MSRTTIVYRDVPPGINEDASVSAVGASSHSSVATLPFGTLLADAPAISCEQNAWGLDGSYSCDDAVPFWSALLSGGDCRFSVSPAITAEFTRQYSTTGITLTFGALDWCRSVKLQWYQQSTLKAEQTFYPDGATYFCERAVSAFDKLVITPLETALPYRFAKLERLYFGRNREFNMQEIRGATVTQEFSSAVLEVPVGILKWTLDSRDDTAYMFQFKQPVEVYSDGELTGRYYIDSAVKKGVGLYDVSCTDVFGLLDGEAFAGGCYQNQSAVALLRTVLGNSYTLEVSAEDTTLTGIIAPCTKREAVQQILFAWGCCITAGVQSDFCVFTLPAESTIIGDGRIFSGGSTETESTVTAVTVIAHSYATSSSGTIEIGGQKYTDTKTVYTAVNPDATASDRPNVKAIETATLISAANAQATADRVLAYYLRKSVVKPKIVWDGERLGDRLTVSDGFGGTYTGYLEKAEIRLSNTIVANCEVRA